MTYYNGDAEICCESFDEAYASVKISKKIVKISLNGKEKSLFEVEG